MSIFSNKSLLTKDFYLRISTLECKFPRTIVVLITYKMSSVNSCLSFTAIKTNGKWFLMRKGSKNKLGKRLLAHPQPRNTMTLQGQYENSDLAKRHHYVKDKKEYLSIYPSVCLSLSLYLIAMKFLNQPKVNAGTTSWAYWSELWNDNTRSVVCPQINAACVCVPEAHGICCVCLAETFVLKIQPDSSLPSCKTVWLI